MRFHLFLCLSLLSEHNGTLEVVTLHEMHARVLL